jgi:hypothetical protein
MKDMAKKLKLMSLFQEISGRAQVTNRRPAPASAAMYLMQLRSQSGAAVLPRRRFMISVDLSQTQPLPHPVKINHVRATEASPEPGARPVRVAISAQPSGVPQVHSKAD